MMTYLCPCGEGWQPLVQVRPHNPADGDLIRRNGCGHLDLADDPSASSESDRARLLADQLQRSETARAGHQPAATDVGRPQGRYCITDRSSPGLDP